MLDKSEFFYFNYSCCSARFHCFTFLVSVIDAIIIIFNIFASISKFSGKGVSDPCSLNPDPDPDTDIVVKPDPHPDR